MARMTTRFPHAVLWDMDGTIVDTEPYWMAAETELVESFGGRWTHEQALQLVGLGLETSGAILQAAGVDMSVQEIVDHLTEAVMTRLVEEGNPYRPGAPELLARLREAGVKVGLVTMSLRAMALTVAAGLPADTFDVVVGGDDVERPKPFPDAYLAAAEALGVGIESCVAIEDSPNGLRSAIASGAVTVGVPHIVALDDVGAHELWPTLAGRNVADLSALLERHRGSDG